MRSIILNSSLSRIILICFVLISQLTFAQNRTDDLKANFEVLKDVPYDTDPEQNMDIYLAKNANSYPSGITIIFLHGGGYYLSDKSKEERYIEPYLERGFNVVNVNYRLKRGIPIATEDLTKALNYLHDNNSKYRLNLKRVVVSGFSAGAHMATLVGVTQNDKEYPNKLNKGIKIIGIINFSGPVDGLDVVEKIFIDNEMEMMKTIGRALFTTDGYASNEIVSVYEPITYLDKKDPPIFLWHGGRDEQIPPKTFESFIELLRKYPGKNVVIYDAEAGHSPTAESLATTYKEVFLFIEKL